MSYILDALRKLEEKEARQGAGPGRHFGGGPPPGRPPGRKKAVMILAGAAAGMVLLTSLVIVGLRRGTEEKNPPAIDVAPQERTGPMRPVPEEGGAGDRPSARKVAAIAPAPPEPEAEPEEGEAALPESGVNEPDKGSPEDTSKPAAGEEISFEEVFGDLDLENIPEPHGSGEPVEDWNAFDSAEESKQAVPAAGEGRKEDPVTGPESGKLYGLEDIPADVRDELPELSITGHIHSDDASFRILTVSDEVKREGDTVFPGLVLEEITATGAHFRYRGYLFFVSAF